MKRRTSILLEEHLYRRVARRAEQEGTTFTDQVREALEEHVRDGGPDETWLEDLIGIGHSGNGLPSVDSDEARDEMAREMWRRNMNREPDW